MSYEATYNPSDPTVPNVVTAWNDVDTPTGHPNTINNPDISLFPPGTTYQNIVPQFVSKVVGNQLVLFSQQDSLSWATALATALNLSQRAAAVVYVDSSVDIGKLHRALADVLIAELNTLISWMSQTNTNIFNATSLADLKTRQASNAAPSSVTLAQAKTAIKNDINSGGVD